MRPHVSTAALKAFWGSKSRNRAGLPKPDRGEPVDHVMARTALADLEDFSARRLGVPRGRVLAVLLHCKKRIPVLPANE